MKPTRIVTALWIVLALQLSSCVTLVNMETVRPPVVQVGHDQWKVLVVNRYDASQGEHKNERVLEVFRDGAYQAAGGAMGAIYNDSTFVLLNEEAAVSLPSSPAKPELSQEEVKQLYSSNPAHLILTLDKFDVRLNKEVESYEDEDGSRAKVAHYDLIVSTGWTLYDSTGAVVDRATVEQAEPYDSRAVISGLLALGPAMGKTGPTVNRLAVEAGYSYWDRLYPKPSLLVRQVHMSKKLNDANYLLYTLNFQEAINTLLPLAQDTAYKHNAKAAHNLAVAYEAAGNYEQAVYWARQAQSKGDKLALNLIELWAGAGIIK